MEHLFLHGILHLHSSAVSVFIINCIKRFVHHFDDCQVHRRTLFWGEVAIRSIEKQKVDSVHIYAYSLNNFVSTFSNRLTFRGIKMSFLDLVT